MQRHVKNLATVKIAIYTYTPRYALKPEQNKNWNPQFNTKNLPTDNLRNRKWWSRRVEYLVIRVTLIHSKTIEKTNFNITIVRNRITTRLPLKKLCQWQK